MASGNSLSLLESGVCFFLCSLCGRRTFLRRTVLEAPEVHAAWARQNSGPVTTRNRRLPFPVLPRLFLEPPPPSVLGPPPDFGRVLSPDYPPQLNPAHQQPRLQLSNVDGKAPFSPSHSNRAPSGGTGAFHQTHWGPRDKGNTLGGTDGPPSAQINQTPLTPSALSRESYWLQWHLLLGAQLYSLVSPTRLPKAAISSTRVGSIAHGPPHSGLTPEWGDFQPPAACLDPGPGTRGPRRGQRVYSPPKSSL